MKNSVNTVYTAVTVMLYMDVCGIENIYHFNSANIYLTDQVSLIIT